MAKEKFLLILVTMHILVLEVCLAQEVYCRDNRDIIGFGVAGSRKCFFIYPSSQISKRLKGVSYKVAKQFCTSRNTVLAEINNFLEQFAISTKLREEFIKKKVPNAPRYFRIAGRETDAGDFHFLDGRLLRQQGCFVTRLPIFLGEAGDMTPNKCIELCQQKSKKYTGVRESKNLVSCFCGDSFSRANAVRCTKRCHNLKDSALKFEYFCGSNQDHTALAIYATYGAFSKFDYGQPSWKQNTSTDYHSCIVMKRFSGRFDDQRCFERGRSALCEIRNMNEEKCVKKNYSWLPVVKRCVKFKQQSYNSWFDARDSCIQDSGDLSIVDEREYYNTASNMLITDFRSKNFWIGAMNRRYIWDISQTPITYSRFHPSEAFNSKENCFALDISAENENGDISWIDLDCNDARAHGMICMIELTDFVIDQNITTTVTSKETQKPTNKETSTFSTPSNKSTMKTSTTSISTPEIQNKISTMSNKASTVSDEYTSEQYTTESIQDKNIKTTNEFTTSTPDNLDEENSTIQPEIKKTTKKKIN